MSGVGGCTFFTKLESINFTNERFIWGPIRLTESVICPQKLGERETETRTAQDQVSNLQGELTRLRQEQVEKSAHEDRLRQQLAEKEERTRKAIVGAKQKINHLVGKKIKAFSTLV